MQFKSIEAVERACEMRDTNMMGREVRIDSVRRKEEAAPSGDPVQGCWFCLSSDKADVNLIISIGVNLCHLPSHMQEGWEPFRGASDRLPLCETCLTCAPGISHGTMGSAVLSQSVTEWTVVSKLAGKGRNLWHVNSIKL